MSCLDTLTTKTATPVDRSPSSVVGLSREPLDLNNGGIIPMSHVGKTFRRLPNVNPKTVLTC